MVTGWYGTRMRSSCLTTRAWLSSPWAPLCSPGWWTHLVRCSWLRGWMRHRIVGWWSQTPTITATQLWSAIGSSTSAAVAQTAPSSACPNATTPAGLGATSRASARQRAPASMWPCPTAWISQGRGGMLTTRPAATIATRIALKMSLCSERVAKHVGGASAIHERRRPSRALAARMTRSTGVPSTGTAPGLSRATAVSTSSRKSFCRPAPSPARSAEVQSCRMFECCG
mmetsp:Transcript_109608/g.261408  ORF Transcript_109608/g.261408 Transcript_109608/m.261408 type:complete len:228 (+) Transcript_109608:446-1129(+)